MYTTQDIQDADNFGNFGDASDAAHYLNTGNLREAGQFFIPLLEIVDHRIHCVIATSKHGTRNGYLHGWLTVADIVKAEDQRTAKLEAALAKIEF